MKKKRQCYYTGRNEFFKNTDLKDKFIMKFKPDSYEKLKNFFNPLGLNVTDLAHCFFLFVLNFRI